MTLKKEDLGAFRPAINSFNPTFYFDALNLSVARQEEPVHFCLEVGPHKGLLL